MALQRRGFSKTAAKDPKIHNQSTNQHNQHTQGIHSSKYPGPQVSLWRLVAVVFKCIFCYYQVELCCNNNLKSLMIFDRRGNLPYRTLDNEHSFELAFGTQYLSSFLAPLSHVFDLSPYILIALLKVYLWLANVRIPRER